MKRNPERFHEGTIHETLYNGKIVVTKYINSREVYVRFVATGYECKTTSPKITAGKIKDPLNPCVCGVGYIGIGIHRPYKPNGGQTDAYRKWASMINRCYSEALKKKQPCYRECTSCEEWHNFQNFADWYYENLPENKTRVELDKDGIKKTTKFTPQSFAS